MCSEPSSLFRLFPACIPGTFFFHVELSEDLQQNLLYSLGRSPFIAILSFDIYLRKFPIGHFSVILQIPVA